jgi:hypothetical protein
MDKRGGDETADPSLLPIHAADGRVDAGGLLGTFKTDLWLPRYKPVAGPWSLRAHKAHGTRGYWGELFDTNGTVILCGPDANGSDTAWMSLTPWEIESQAIGIAAAQGHTVVLGLGMGWQAANVARNAAVEAVTVVERNADVIALIEGQRIFEQLPPPIRSKITVVQADAHLWQPSLHVDTLLADIWEKTFGDQRIADIQRLQGNIRATRLYAWGQEIELWRCARRRAHEALDWPLLRAIVAEDFDLPLILPDWPDYPAKIAKAGKWWGPTDEE